MWAPYLPRWAPYGKSLYYISPIFRGYFWIDNPQESLENGRNTMATLLDLLGVHQQ